VGALDRRATACFRCFCRSEALAQLLFGADVEQHRHFRVNDRQQHPLFDWITSLELQPLDHSFQWCGHRVALSDPRLPILVYCLDEGPPDDGCDFDRHRLWPHRDE